MSPNDEGSQFPKVHLTSNEEERLVLNSIFRDYKLYSKQYKPAKGSLSSSQLFVTSPHLFNITTNFIGSNKLLT